MFNKIKKFKEEKFEKQKHMDEDFEQNFTYRTAKGNYRCGHDSIRKVKWMAYYDGYYEKMNYFDLMASVLSTFK